MRRQMTGHRQFLANVNSRSRSLYYVIARPSVGRLSVSVTIVPEASKLVA